MKRLAFATHAAVIDGKEYEALGDLLIEALGTSALQFYMVRHFMDGSRPSRIEKYQDGTRVTTKKLVVVRKPGPVRYVSEIVSTVWYFTFRKKVEVYVGIDPLNALTGVLLKKLGRIERNVFYTPDYSPERFSNATLNKVYHAVDRYCVRHADEVWCVSPRIQEVRRAMGLPESKNLLIPNVPPATFDRLRTNSHDKFALISSGMVDKQLDNEGVIRAVAELLPRYPKLTFTIVGNGPDEERLKKLATRLKVQKQIIFTGRLPLEATYERYSYSGISLALYTGEWGFNTYGDSSKARQGFYLGLPVLTTDTHATVPEIRDAKAGVVAEKNVAAYVAGLEEILSHYDAYAKRAYVLGEKYHDIHRKRIMELVS